MTKKKWISKIKREMGDAYDVKYKSVVDALAEILEQRDKVMEEYVDAGSHPVIFSGTITRKSPHMQLYCDLAKSALAYWRELGLTPSSLRKITGDNPAKDREVKGLVKALAELDI